MFRKQSFFKNILVVVSILTISFIFCLILTKLFAINEQITIIFLFAIYLISIFTDGYLSGIIAAFIVMFLVNYAFTYPYFAVNFTIPENFISAIIMISVSLMTSTLTTQLKHQEYIKAESEKERMRANLLRSVSHDLRTPLTTIYGASSTILENQNTISEEQINKMLKGIQEDSEWLIRMVENLLSITKIDNGKIKIFLTPTVLEELIDSVIIKFKKRYPNQNIEINIPDEMIIINMDPILIEQVITNILENAIHHARGMTKLLLRVYKHENQAIFEVSDNGCGINDDKLKNIFKGFYETKEHPADSHRRNVGIGLSVCATIIKSHGGTISAENRSTGGATFRFSLNLEEPTNE